MLLHIDASKYAWFGDGRYYDLITLMDDATSEIYYAQLVEEEGTRTLMPAVREVIEQEGVFCAPYSDRASHFFVTPKAGGKLEPGNAVGAGATGAGDQDDPGVLAASAGAYGTQLPDLAGGDCRKSCGYAESPRWRRPTDFCARSTGPNSTGGLGLPRCCARDKSTHRFGFHIWLRRRSRTVVARGEIR
jgi:hypothetical protein